MIYVMKFMFYVMVAMTIVFPVGLYISWNMDEKKVDFKDYCKTL